MHSIRPHGIDPIIPKILKIFEMTQKANYVPNVIFPRFWGVLWSKSGLCFPFFGNEQSLYYLKSTLPGNSRRKRAYMLKVGKQLSCLIFQKLFENPPIWPNMNESTFCSRLHFAFCCRCIW